MSSRHVTENQARVLPCGLQKLPWLRPVTLLLAQSIEKWLRVEISGLLQGWGTRISQESHTPRVVLLRERQLCSRALPVSKPWCILLRTLPWDPLSFEAVPPSLCGKEDSLTGPSGLSQIRCVVSKFFGSQGPRGSPRCGEAQPCPLRGPGVGEDRRGGVGNRASSPHRRAHYAHVFKCLRPLAERHASFQI